MTYLHHMHREWRRFVGEKKMIAITDRRMRERIESPEGMEQGTEAAAKRARTDDGGFAASATIVPARANRLQIPKVVAMRWCGKRSMLPR